MPDRLLWTAAAWADYVYWQGQDRKTLKRINALIQDTMRHPFEGKDLAIVACRYHYE